MKFRVKARKFSSMLNTQRASVLVVLATLAAAGALATPNSATASGAIRYASPTGTDNVSCTPATPCDILTAIEQAPAASTVVIESGTYYKSAPLGSEISDGSRHLTIEGPAT